MNSPDDYELPPKSLDLYEAKSFLDAGNYQRAMAHAAVAQAEAAEHTLAAVERILMEVASK